MSKTLNKKNLAVILAVSILVTGGYIWTHRNDAPLGWASMHDFGIVFNFPQHIPVDVSTPMGWNQNYWEGAVQGEFASGGFELVGLFWKTGVVNTEEAGLTYLLEFALKDNPTLTWGGIQLTKVRNYEVAYADIDIAANGVDIPGAIAAFFDPYGRLMVTYHLGSSGGYDSSFEMVKKSIRSMSFDEPVDQYVLESYWPTEGWWYATPFQVGMDESKLLEMVEDIENSSFDVDSVMVIRDGYIVLDEYFGDYGKDDTHIIYSCTKSVVSTIFGIAYENGEVPDLDTRLLDLFPDATPENPSEWKNMITLQDLLMMSGGFNARDSWLYDWEGLTPLHNAEDAVRYMLDLPMYFEPGSRFEYTNGVSHLLSCIITERTGVSAAEYGDEYLFGPLGITDYTWDTDVKGRNWGYTRIYFTPHDMAKIGFLFLNEGMWGGEQIISSEWVREATKHRLDGNLLDGYGYQWWVGDGFYAAVGYQGQFIFVFPEQNVVAVFTGSSPETFDYTIRLPGKYIIPAVN